MADEQQQQQPITDPTRRPADPKERRRQTDPKTKKYKDSAQPDWEIERLLRSSAEYRAWLRDQVAHLNELDPVERAAIQELARDLPPDR